MKKRKSRLTKLQRERVLRYYVKGESARSCATAQRLSRRTTTSLYRKFRRATAELEAYFGAQYFYKSRFIFDRHPLEFIAAYKKGFAIVLVSGDQANIVDYFLIPRHLAGEHQFVDKIYITPKSDIITASNLKYSVDFLVESRMVDKALGQQQLIFLETGFSSHLSRYRGIPSKNFTEHFCEFLFFLKIQSIHKRLRILDLMLVKDNEKSALASANLVA